MRKIKTLVLFLLKLAISEKIVTMLFILGGIALMIVNMTYADGIKQMWKSYELDISVENIPFVVASFFSIVCVVIISCSSYWWVLKEFFRHENSHFFLMKPVSWPVVSFSVLTSGMLLIASFVVFLEAVFSVIALFHTRSLYPLYVGVNTIVLWYLGCLCFFYFCYFFAVWKNPVCIILSLMVAGAGFVSHRIDTIQSPNSLMRWSLQLGQFLIPPIDKFWTISAFEYRGDPGTVFIKTIPVFFLLYASAFLTIGRLYESKRQK